MIAIGWLDAILKRNSELAFSFDLDTFQKNTNHVHMKRLAIDICISFLARTISQSEFRVKNGESYIKDELYYRLNVRPSKNVTASTFWQTFIYKLVYDNECLIIQADDGDLLIADDFTHKEYAVYDDIFSNVVVKDFEFQRIYTQSEVIHLRYSNEILGPLIDSLFEDYGKLFGSLLNSQKRKNQVRSTVKVDAVTAKSKEGLENLQEFINKMYKAIEGRDVAIIPEQPGFEYKEHFTGSGNGIQSVDEINKITNGFLDQVAMTIGIPVSLLRGDMADVEKQTKNYMFFTVAPLLKKIKDEADVKFFTKEEFLNGECIDIRKASYQNIFDLATAVDKLISSGVFNGDEIRTETGYDITGEEIHQQYFITKNYQESGQALEGGENTETENNG